MSCRHSLPCVWVQKWDSQEYPYFLIMLNVYCQKLSQKCWIIGARWNHPTICHSSHTSVNDKFFSRHGCAVGWYGPSNDADSNIPRVDQKHSQVSKRVRDRSWKTYSWEWRSKFQEYPQLFHLYGCHTGQYFSIFFIHHEMCSHDFLFLLLNAACFPRVGIILW